MERSERARGCLVGVAVGDALGFPLEGLSARRVRRRFGALQDYRFLGSTGFVSDDTEQTVMLGESIVTAAGDPKRSAGLFGSRLVGWFWTIPPGVGLATVRASLKLTVGLAGGVTSAGNGAAMRAAPLGLWPAPRRPLVEAVSRVTHTDPRGVDAARCLAEGVAALLDDEFPDLDCLRARVPDLDPRLEGALAQAWECVAQGLSAEETARKVGTGGYVLHSLPLAFTALWRKPATFLEGLHGVILQGGDTDSTGAMAGALLGTWLGRGAIPENLAAHLEPCFSATRLEKLAEALLQGHFGADYRRAHPLALRWREVQIKLGVGVHVLGRLVP